MPFRLYNAPVIFQKIINYIINNYLGKFVMFYLDDILVFLKDIESHTKHLKWIFQQLEKVKTILEEKTNAILDDKFNATPSYSVCRTCSFWEICDSKQLEA